MPELEMSVGAESGCEPVELQPFIHQVGGHTSMFRFNDNTVCKPLCSREFQFYTTLPPELHPFTPEFKGSIEVQLLEDTDGYITFVGYPSTSDTKPREAIGSAYKQVRTSPGQSTANDSCSMRLLRSGSLEVCCQTEEKFSDSKSEDGSVRADGLNPWSLNCHKRQLAKMRKAKKDSDTKFILLENVAAQFTCPCVLDLKMGTRQHGDDAPESKKKSQMRKCEATTSASIGLRICGMQVYQAPSRRYICHNKYYGRSLSVDGFKLALHQFLHNGRCLRQDIVRLLVAKLRELHSVVERQDTFRFYSSSLLIMYDGAEQSSGRHSSSQQPSHIPSTNSSTCGSWEPDTNNATSVPSMSSDVHCDNHTHRSVGVPLVDVRMIDFAHATHKDFLQDVAGHDGPDHGYLFGLQNLMALLGELEEGNGSRS